MRNEMQLASRIVQWMRNQHWEVYQEVQRIQYGPVADIVGALGKLRWVVECKRSLSLALMEQAMMWLGKAHFVSIAFPESHSASRGRAAARRFCEQNGIGMMAAGRSVRVYTGPAMFRKAKPWVLHEAQKTFAPAGTASGKHWTPFQETCLQLHRVVFASPGICLKEAMASIKHHYSTDATARATISHYLQHNPQILGGGLECRRDGKFLRLYAK